MQLRSRYIADMNGLNLSQLPPDLFRSVLEQVASPDLTANRDREMASDLAQVARVCKQFQEHTEPYLYQKVYTRIGTPHNTAWLANLLHRRVEVASWVRVLVLDEFHPRELRNVLSCEMRLLKYLVIQHEGDDVETLDSQEIELLNRRVCQQPRLEVVVVRLEWRYKLAEHDAFLFRYASIWRVRLSALNFSAFENLPPTYFQRKGPVKVDIDGSEYTQQALERLIVPLHPTPYHPIIIKDCHCSSTPPGVPFISQLSVAGEISVLNLRWINLDPRQASSMYSSVLKVLGNLGIDHHFLVAAERGINDLQNRKEFLAFADAKFPLHIKQLMQRVSSKEQNDPSSLRIQGLDVEVPYQGEEVIEAVIRLKEESVPGLEVLFIDCNSRNPNLEGRLFRVAEEHGVVLGVFQSVKSTPVGQEISERVELPSGTESSDPFRLQ